MSRRFQGGESSEILSQSSVKNEDMFQCRHEVGTVNDSDKAVPLSVIQSCPVATCETAGGTAAKVGVVNNFSDFTLLNGREVLVYFASGNTADNPTFNLNNTGAFPLALENQLSTVSIGSGCWGDGVFLHLKYVDITVSNTRIQKWLICGHRIASQSSTQTTYADGQGRTNTVASGNMQSVTSNAVDDAINSLRPKEIYEEKTTTFEVPVGNVELVLFDWRGYAGYYWIGLILSFQSGITINPISTNTTNIPISASGHTVTVSYEEQIPMVTRYKMNNVAFY